MNRRYMALLGIVLVIGCVMVVSSGALAGQSESAATQQPQPQPYVAVPNWAPAMTPWGEPDLQGIWDNRSGIPFERDRKYGAREILTLEEAIQRTPDVADGDDGGAADDLAKQDEQRNAAADKPDDGRPGYRIAGAEYNAFWNAPLHGQEVSLRSSQIVDPPDGRVPPFTAATLDKWEAREKARAHRGQADDWEDRALTERCLARSGLPNEMNTLKEILQGPGYVSFQLLYQHTRVVPTDGRPHAGETARLWWGNSRGRWEGNTLVIETTNFRDPVGTVVPSHGGPYAQSDRRIHDHYYPGSGAQFTLTERITRLGPNHIEYRYTVSDPETFVRPFTAVNVWTIADDSKQIFEYSCHEHNYGMVNAMAGARVDEAWALGEAKREMNQRLDSLKAEREELRAWESTRTSDGR